MSADAECSATPLFCPSDFGFRKNSPSGQPYISLEKKFGRKRRGQGERRIRPREREREKRAFGFVNLKVEWIRANEERFSFFSVLSTENKIEAKKRAHWNSVQIIFQKFLSAFTAPSYFFDMFHVFCPAGQYQDLRVHPSPPLMTSYSGKWPFGKMSGGLRKIFRSGPRG